MLAGLGALATLAVSAWAPGTMREADVAARDPAGRFSLLALGDTGRYASRWSPFDPQLAVARGLESEDARSAADLLLLLGDNFYWDGLAALEIEARVRANLVRPYCRFVDLSALLSERIASACQRRAEERHVVPIVAVLGNHDYGGEESPRLERDAVPLYVRNWRASRGLVETLEVAPGVSLILLDSELVVDQRADLAPLARALGEAAGPWRVLVTHRPIVGAEEPGVAKRVRKAIGRAAHAPQLVLSGHEHNLQVWEEAEAPGLHLVAGSGSHVREVVGTGSSFAREVLGFVRLDLVEEAAGGERFVASFFETGGLPWLAGTPRLVARFSVDLAGRSRRESIGEAPSVARGAR